MEIKINIEKRHLFILILAVGLLGIGIVRAGWANPNGVGHSFDEIELCSAEEILKTNSSNSWECIPVDSIVPEYGDIESISGTAPLTFSAGCETGNCSIGLTVDASGNCDSSGSVCGSGHTHSGYLTAESDPQVGSISNNKICYGSGSQAICNDNAFQVIGDTIVVVDGATNTNTQVGTFRLTLVGGAMHDFSGIYTIIPNNVGWFWGVDVTDNRYKVLYRGSGGRWSTLQDISHQ